MAALLCIGGTVLLTLGLDWLSKAWAERELLLHNPVPIVGEFVQLTLGYNTGAAFGVFSNSGFFLLFTSGVIIGVLVATLVQAVRAGTKLPTFWPVTLVLGGALANFLDRLPDGRVTDFLDLGVGELRWPTFNLADSVIVVGILSLVYLVLLHPSARGELQ